MPLGHRDKRGFTLLELLIAMAIIVILASLAIYFYQKYLDRAQRTLSVSALEGFRKMVELYVIDYGTYPPAIDFSTCTATNGRPIMPITMCEQLKRDVYSLDSYTVIGNGYLVMAKAKDSQHSVLRLSQDQAVTIISP